MDDVQESKQNQRTIRQAKANTRQITRTRAGLRFCLTNFYLAKSVGGCVTNAGQGVQVGVEIRW